MGGKVRYVLRRHLFLLIGLVSLSLFFLVAWLDRTNRIETSRVLAAPMRVLIVPMYLVWLLGTIIQVAIVGPRGLPESFAAVVFGINFLAGLAPYALADYILERWRRPKPLRKLNN